MTSTDPQNGQHLGTVSLPRQWIENTQLHPPHPHSRHLSSMLIASLPRSTALWTLREHDRIVVIVEIPAATVLTKTDRQYRTTHLPSLRSQLRFRQRRSRSTPLLSANLRLSHQTSKPSMTSPQPGQKFGRNEGLNRSVQKKPHARQHSAVNAESPPDASAIPTLTFGSSLEPTTARASRRRDLARSLNAPHSRA